MLWINPHRQLGSKQPLAYSPYSRREGENGKGERENWWDEIKTVEQGTQKLCVQANQNKEFIHCFPSAGRCSTIHSKRVMHTVNWDNKCHNSECTPFLFLSPSF